MELHDSEEEKALRAAIASGTPAFEPMRQLAALHASQTGTFFWDPVADTVNWDAQAGSLLGFARQPGSAPLAQWIAALQFDQRSGFERVLRDCASGAGGFDTEFCISQADDSIRWINCQGQASTWRHRVCIAGTLADISKYKRTEDILRSSTQRLQLALAAGHLGEWSWDAATDIVDFGDRACQIFGLEEGQKITWTALREILHEDDRERARIAVEQALLQHSDYNTEYRIHRSDGAAWIAAQGRGIYAPDGSVVGMIGVVRDISAQKVIENSLAESLERIRATVDQAAVGIAIASLDGRFQETNDKFAQIVGHESAVLPGLTFAELTHPDDLDHTRQEMSRLLRGDVPSYSCEKRYVRKDGGIVWSNTTVTLIKDGTGKPQRFLGIIQDITQRKQTEAALRQSESFNRTIIENSRDCTKLLDLDGRILWMNDYGLQAVAIASLDQIRGRYWADFWPEADRERARDAVRTAAAGGTGCFVGSVRVQGLLTWWDVVITPINQADGQPEKLLAVSRNITDRMVAEQALQEETRVLEMLHHTGTMLASQLDLQSLLQSVTDAATQLSGAKFGAFFYNTVDDNGDSFMLYTLSGAPREAFEKFGKPRATPLFAVTFNGEGVVRCDDVLTDPRYGRMAPHRGMPAGHLPVRSYLAVPVRLRSGETIGGLFFGHPEPGVFTERAERIITSIASQASIAIDNAKLYEAAQSLATEREELLVSERHARAEALRMSELKDEFLATLSHELRTPLSAILGWAQILRRGAAAEADLHKGVDTIERNARVQVQLIDDLLDMSRIVSGKIRLDLQMLDPVECVEAAMETVRPSAEVKNIQLRAQLDRNAGKIFGDAARLQQVLWNLLSNAIKFTPAGGSIDVFLRSTDDRVSIAVTDNGVGIKPEFLPYVFDRFRQADSSTTRRFGGLGLGLSIVRHLVDLHAGTVTADSPGPGLGATFTVQLPLAGPRQMHQPSEAPAGVTSLPAARAFETADLQGVKVLIVDDEPDARDLLGRLLAECEAEVVTAATPDEALMLAERERPDVFISDIGMPGTDGFELLRRIRLLGSERGGRVPAIALTAFGRPEDRAKVLRAGFLGHLTKPVEPSELVTMIANIVQRA